MLNTSQKQEWQWHAPTESSTSQRCYFNLLAQNLEVASCNILAWESGEITICRLKHVWKWKAQLNWQSSIQISTLAVQLVICNWVNDFWFKLFCVEFVLEFACDMLFALQFGMGPMIMCLVTNQCSNHAQYFEIGIAPFPFGHNLSQNFQIKSKMAVTSPKFQIQSEHSKCVKCNLKLTLKHAYVAWKTSKCLNWSKKLKNHSRCKNFVLCCIVNSAIFGVNSKDIVWDKMHCRKGSKNNPDPSEVKVCPCKRMKLTSGCTTKTHQLKNPSRFFHFSTIFAICKIWKWRVFCICNAHALNSSCFCFEPLKISHCHIAAQRNSALIGHKPDKKSLACAMVNSEHAK